MTIKNEDLNLLIQIENFLGTNFPRGSEGQDLAWVLCSLNEKLIMQRSKQNSATHAKIKECRRETPTTLVPQGSTKRSNNNPAHRVAPMGFYINKNYLRRYVK